MVVETTIANRFLRENAVDLRSRNLALGAASATAGVCRQRRGYVVGKVKTHYQGRKAAIRYTPWGAPSASSSVTASGRQCDKARNALADALAYNIGEGDHNSNVEEDT